MSAPIQKYLTMAGNIVLEQHHQELGSLHQFVREQRTGREDAASEAAGSRSILRIIRRALAHQRIRPRQRLGLAEVDWSLRVPDGAEIRLAVSCTRRRPG